MKLKDLNLKLNIHQIALAAILITIGIVLETYLRIDKLTFFSVTIYIMIGLMLPLHLGVISAFILDTLQLLLRGVLGFWFWSLQLETVFIVISTFSFKYIFMLLKNKIIINLVSIVFITIIIITSSIVMGINIQEFSLERNVSKTGIETYEKYIARLIEKYLSLCGIIISILYTIKTLYCFNTKKIDNKSTLLYMHILFITILIDWLYHPYAIQVWRESVFDIKPNWFLFKGYVVKGIIKSMFHIFVSILIVPIIYKAFNNHSISGNHKY